MCRSAFEVQMIGSVGRWRQEGQAQCCEDFIGLLLEIEESRFCFMAVESPDASCRYRKDCSKQGKLTRMVKRRHFPRDDEESKENITCEPGPKHKWKVRAAWQQRASEWNLVKPDQTDIYQEDTDKSEYDEVTGHHRERAKREAENCGHHPYRNDGKKNQRSSCCGRELLRGMKLSCAQDPVSGQRNRN